MDNIKAKTLRKRLDTKLIKLIAPNNMSVAEYKIKCNLEGIDPSVENGQFLHWVMTADGDDTKVVEKVHNAIVNALNKKYLLDLDNAEQCSYFCDAMCDIVLANHDYKTKMFEAVLKNYKGSGGYGDKVFNHCKDLNKSFGFTNVEYFNDGF